MSSDKGKVIVIVAPSGTGKTTLINKIKSTFPEIEESISSTTRHKRPGDIDGQQYFFLTREEFEQKIKEDEFLEWAVVHENYYGTSKKFINEKIKMGKFVLCDIDVQGADSVKKHFGDESEIIFISPPSIETLRERLEGRATDPQDVIEIRLGNAKKEMERRDDYDHLVINDKLDVAISDLESVIRKIIEG